MRKQRKRHNIVRREMPKLCFRFDLGKGSPITVGIYSIKEDDICPMSITNGNTNDQLVDTTRGALQIVQVEDQLVPDLKLFRTPIDFSQIAVRARTGVLGIIGTATTAETTAAATTSKLTLRVIGMIRLKENLNHLCTR